MRCTICERKCDINDGGIGGCGMMTCIDNEIQERYPDRYLVAVDTAIESMPMVHFHPRGKFLQVCTVGCNFNCRGCVSDIPSVSLSIHDQSRLDSGTHGPCQHHSSRDFCLRPETGGGRILPTILQHAIGRRTPTRGCSTAENRRPNESAT